MTKRDFPPVHPGEILLTEFLEPMGVTQYRLAKDIGVAPRRINEIVHGRRSITADTALRLGRFFFHRNICLHPRKPLRGLGHQARNRR